MNETWQAWLIAGGILFIIELFTPGFVAAVFGGACLVTAIPAALGAPIWGMVVVFITATLGLTLGARPLFVRKHVAHPARTNAAALVGCIATVQERIDNQASTGRVLVEGDDWRAVSDGNDPISAGERVVVNRVESNRLHVCRFGQS
jgi:membrane protein implicated in regulation of membrane protease activity